jgi:hypothetical protein
VCDLCDFCWEIACPAHNCACVCDCAAPDDADVGDRDHVGDGADAGEHGDGAGDGAADDPAPPSPGPIRLRGGGDVAFATAVGVAAGTTAAVGVLGLAFFAWRSLAARAPPILTFADKPHVEVRRSRGCGLGLFARCDMDVGTAVVSMERPTRIHYASAAARAEALQLPSDSFVVVANQRPSAFCDFSWIDPDVSAPAWYYLNHAGRAFANVEMVLRRNPATHILQVVWVACAPIASGSELRYAYGGPIPRDWLMGSEATPPPYRSSSSPARPARRRSRPARPAQPPRAVVTGAPVPPYGGPAE